MALKPPTPAAQITASLPPVTITSALFKRILSKASMIALVDDAQALTTAKFGPRKPWRIDICPAAISNIILGIKKGLNLGVPSPLP